ncbi:MAG: hypothetical protein HYY37_02150 [Candidatus Aenigmarchaeota archaeon]|nr:hypothetical protein [Candidatus Aenigmarchaeota archaeon]
MNYRQVAGASRTPAVCGECPLWQRAAMALCEDGMKGHRPEDLAPYCAEINTHVPYDSPPECERYARSRNQ